MNVVAWMVTCERNAQPSRYPQKARFAVLWKVKRAVAAMAAAAQQSAAAFQSAALADALALAAEGQRGGPLILHPGGRPTDPARVRGQRSLRKGKKKEGVVDPVPGRSA